MSDLADERVDRIEPHDSRLDLAIGDCYFIGERRNGRAFNLFCERSVLLIDENGEVVGVM